MARPTRSQRRARREAQAQSGAGERAQQQQPQPQRRPTPPAGEHAEVAHERAIPGRGTGRFIGESWGELKKVEWPTQNHVVQGTIVVLIACVIVGFYLWLSDQAFRRLVQDVILGG